MNATKFQEQFQRIVDEVDGAARDNARTMIPRGTGPGDTWEGIDAIKSSAESIVTDMLSERTTGYREWVLTQAQANRVLAAVEARYGRQNRPKVAPVQPVRRSRTRRPARNEMTIERKGELAGIAWIESEAAIDCSDKELEDEAEIRAGYYDDPVEREAYRIAFLRGALSMLGDGHC